MSRHMVETDRQVSKLVDLTETEQNFLIISHSLMIFYINRDKIIRTLETQGIQHGSIFINSE